MIVFYNQARIEVGDTTVGRVTGCDVSIRLEMYGYELSFEFHILLTDHYKHKPRDIMEFKVEASSGFMFSRSPAAALSGYLAAASSSSSLRR